MLQYSLNYHIRRHIYHMNKYRISKSKNISLSIKGILQSSLKNDHWFYIKSLVKIGSSSNIVLDHELKIIYPFIVFSMTLQLNKKIMDTMPYITNKYKQSIMEIEKKKHQMTHLVSFTILLKSPKQISRQICQSLILVNFHKYKLLKLFH